MKKTLLILVLLALLGFFVFMALDFRTKTIAKLHATEKENQAPSTSSIPPFPSPELSLAEQKKEEIVKSLGKAQNVYSRTYQEKYFLAFQHATSNKELYDFSLHIYEWQDNDWKKLTQKDFSSAPLTMVDEFLADGASQNIIFSINNLGTGCEENCEGWTTPFIIAKKVKGIWAYNTQSKQFSRLVPAKTEMSSYGDFTWLEKDNLLQFTIMEQQGGGEYTFNLKTKRMTKLP